ncbi:MAG TPA: efflux RND transporter periplasmic adaptor subunit [Gemmatimonadales bacterium]|nr:efflux RND transporter periplasmic adaptor subunit [Gemmatimonadales bacterium]
MKRYFAIAGALGLALVIFLAARKGGSAPKTATADSIHTLVLGASDVVHVAPTDLIAGVPVSGTLHPLVDIRIASPIPEILEAVYVREGQAVAQGQALAKFRTDAAGPAALSAEAAVRLDSADYVRMQNLYKEGAVSERDVQNAEVVLRAAQATAASAEKKLSESTVRAPASGVITTKAVDAGDRVKDGDQLFQLANISQLEFEATVPSEFAAQVHQGDAVTLGVTGLKGVQVHGRIARVNATVDPATRQLKLYVSVPNQDRKLVGGLFASGRVVLRQVKGAIAVPQAAVRSDSTGGASYVLMVVNGRIVRRDVEVGALDDQAGLVQISKGVAAGDAVVTGPIPGLRAGDVVTVAGGER